MVLTLRNVRWYYVILLGEGVGGSVGGDLGDDVEDDGSRGGDGETRWVNYPGTTNTLPG